MDRRYYRTAGNFGAAPIAPAGLPQALQQGSDGGDGGGLSTSIANPLGTILDPQVDGSDYFWYGANVASLAPAATSNSQIQIDAGTDFLWIASTYMVNIGGAYPYNSDMILPLVNVQILDTGATKNLMNLPTPIATIASPWAAEPYRLIRPRLFRANSVINFTWTSYDGAGVTYANLFFCMHGIRKIAGSFNLA
jgi:hypothetical protein